MDTAQILELLEYIKAEDFKGMLKYLPEGVIHRSSRYTTEEDFELAGSYEEDARYVYPARGLMIERCLEICITGLKGGEEDSEESRDEEYDPYCKLCGRCGEEGCCSPLGCLQGEGGKYCAGYLLDLKFGYDMYRKIDELVGDDEKYREQIDKMFDETYDKMYKTGE